jgi:rare lipoprotein A
MLSASVCSAIWWGRESPNVSRLGLLLLGLLLVLAGCEHPTAGKPHYVLGEAWQAQGVWHYPSESFDAETTGIAAIYPDHHPALTTDGEVFDQTAMAAAHQTLQMPAIARLTNLDNGLQVLVRINDRGPPDPGRIVAVTRRVATLLQFPANGTARVRLEVLQAESRAAAEAVQGGGASRLDVAAAPRAVVQETALPPPPGARQASGTAVMGAGPVNAAAQAMPSAVAALRQPEILTRVQPESGRLWVELSTFSEYQYANIQRARLAGLGARIDSIRVGRGENFRVRLGPYGAVEDADSALARTIQAGITDGRIVIE